MVSGQSRPRQMTQIDPVPWDPHFFRQSTLFEPVADLARSLASQHPHNWPGLNDYQTLLTSIRDSLQTESGATLRFVGQDGRSDRFEQQYEPRIFLNGEIQTRTANWHDFFQVLVWCLFARTKLRLNKLHYEAASHRYRSQPRQRNRTAIENTVTLFDECGAVVVSSQPDLLDMLRQFHWKQLFWRQRDDVCQHMRCYLFGHALYEKALRPYTGLTAHALLLPVSTAFHDQPLHEQISHIDNWLVEMFSHPRDKIHSRMFHPLPLLGMPGTCDDNRHESYYDNTAYFRSARRSVPGES